VTSAQGEQGARPGGAAGPALGRGHRFCQRPRCHRTSELVGACGLEAGGAGPGGGRRGCAPLAPVTPERFAITCAGGASGPAYLRTPGGGGGPGVAGPIASAGSPTRRPGGQWSASSPGSRAGFAGLALRYERLSSTFAALVYLACFLIAWSLLRWVRCKLRWTRAVQGKKGGL